MRIGDHRAAQDGRGRMDACQLEFSSKSPPMWRQRRAATFGPLGLDGLSVRENGSRTPPPTATAAASSGSTCPNMPSSPFLGGRSRVGGAVLRLHLRRDARAVLRREEEAEAVRAPGPDHALRSQVLNRPRRPRLLLPPLHALQVEAVDGTVADALSGAGVDRRASNGCSPMPKKSSGLVAGPCLQGSTSAFRTKSKQSRTPPLHTPPPSSSRSSNSYSWLTAFLE